MQMTRRAAKVVECGMFSTLLNTLWNYIVDCIVDLHVDRMCVHYAASYGMCDAVKQGLDAPKRVCVFQPAVPSYVNNFIPEYTGQVQRMINSTCGVYCNKIFFT